jgi:hypothetical protein
MCVVISGGWWHEYFFIAINLKSSASDVIYGLFDKQNPEFYMDLTGFVRAGCYSCRQVSSLCFC